MRCKEIKQQIDKSADIFDQNILNHIKTCRSCARAAEAKRVLNSAIQNSRSEKSSPGTPLNLIKTSIEQNIENLKEESLMTKIKKNINARPRLATGFGLLVLAFVFFAAVPFSYTKTIGYDLAMTNVTADDKVQPAKLQDAIMSLGYVNAEVAKDREVVLVKNLPSMEAAVNTKELVWTLTQYDGEPVINRVTSKASAPLLAQVKLRDIYVSSDDELDSSEILIQEEITDKLLKAGVIDDVLILESDDDGNWSAYSTKTSELDSTSGRIILSTKEPDSYYLEYKGNTIMLVTNPENKSPDSLKVRILKDMRDVILLDSGEVNIRILEDGKISKLKIIIDEDNEL